MAKVRPRLLCSLSFALINSVFDSVGLAMSFLQGSKEEWSLVRRHPSEKIFGMQIAGSKPSLLVPAAETIGRECAGNLDFVDLNCGCPIDLVYKTGSGSACTCLYFDAGQLLTSHIVLDAAGRLGKIVVGMSKALGDVPVTVKLRTGVKDGRNTAHKLMPRLAPEFGASALTVRFFQTLRQARAHVLNIDSCTAVLGNSDTRGSRIGTTSSNVLKPYVKEKRRRTVSWYPQFYCLWSLTHRVLSTVPSVPIFGGGDCFSAEDYWHKMDNYGVDGVMIGRGALIKPWIFTEIKERREWDISSRERLELARKVGFSCTPIFL